MLKVLVVDDEPFMRTTIKAVLRAVDRFDVAEAERWRHRTGRDRTNSKPDVVLCDISMPRMGGLQLVAHLRQHPEAWMRDTPVVMLTGHAEEGIVRDALRLQINGYLVKPISPRLLKDRLQNIFAERAEAPSTAAG